MKAAQIRKLMTDNNVAGEVSGAGNKWSVELANDAALRKFRKHVTKEGGGYKCGWGGWVMTPQYESLGDPSDRMSRHHY